MHLENIEFCFLSISTSIKFNVQFTDFSEVLNSKAKSGHMASSAIRILREEGCDEGDQSWGVLLFGEASAYQRAKKHMAACSKQEKIRSNKAHQR